MGSFSIDGRYDWDQATVTWSATIKSDSGSTVQINGSMPNTQTITAAEIEAMIGEAAVEAIKSGQI